MKLHGMTTKSYRTGMDVLLDRHLEWIEGRRVGLVAHPASICEGGVHAAERLHQHPDFELTALFSPEHGYFGQAPAGELIPRQLHPAWDIPVHSLYGKDRIPSREQLEDLDTIIVDLQDLSVRCYTYASTLRNILEAADGAGVSVVVADRMTPLAGVVDGPQLDPDLESFVGSIHTPLVYGMTQAETAAFLRRELGLGVELHLAPVEGWPRGEVSPRPAMWRPPSPGIRRVHTALCYPVTVGFEALPSVWYGQGSGEPFECIASSHLHDARELCRLLQEQGLEGIAFHPDWFMSNHEPVGGVRLSVTDPRTYRPVVSAVALLWCLQEFMGSDELWHHRDSREAFFDQLMGTDRVRLDLQTGLEWREVVESWDFTGFLRDRDHVRLYPD